MHSWDDVSLRFAELLSVAQVPPFEHEHYLKWLRYYRHFCGKYGHDASRFDSLPSYLGKLREKRQTPRQVDQAKHAIMLYYDLIRTDAAITPTSLHGRPCPTEC